MIGNCYFKSAIIFYFVFISLWPDFGFCDTNKTDPFKRKRLKSEEPSAAASGGAKENQNQQEKAGNEKENGVSEAASTKEVTNEDVVRRRKLERQQFGEAQYVDYPIEESKGRKKAKTQISPEAKKRTIDRKRKLLKLRRFHNGLELAEGVAEVGLGVDLFAKVGSEAAAEAAGGGEG